MKVIISGTDRAHSKSLELAKYIQSLYKEFGEETTIIDLAQLDLSSLMNCHYNKQAERPDDVVKAIEMINESEGLIVVCPEYNGSMPGALKLFIDYWSCPQSFEFRPVCFVGLGGRWGGLRPVEHLQGVFGYRNSYVFPQRVFVSNVWDLLKDGKISDSFVVELLQDQAKNFTKFIKALRSQNLDALSVN